MLPSVRLLAVAAWGADPGIIRGAYNDHSTDLQAAKRYGYDVRAAVVGRADSVARLNVNVVWYTNLPNDSGMIAHIVKTYRARGIEIVAGSGYWYAGPFPVEGQWATLQRLHGELQKLGPDCIPWKWSLGDETRVEWLTDLRTLAERCAAAGIPATMVQVPEFHAQTLNMLGARLPILAVDVYPVFQPGLGPVDGIAWGKSEHAAVIRRSWTTGVRPLLMVQGFGGGADPTFALPTPARTRWQVWSAVAAGSPGAVVFAAGMPSPDGGPTPPTPSLIDWDRQTEALTPQGATVAATFSRVKVIEGRLTGAALEAAPALGSVGLRGDCAAIFRPTTGPRLLLVVSDPDAERPRTVKVTLSGVSAASPLADSTGATLQAWPWPWSIWFPATLQVAMQPGEAWIGELR